MSSPLELALDPVNVESEDDPLVPPRYGYDLIWSLQSSLRGERSLSRYVLDVTEEGIDSLGECLCASVKAKRN